VRIANDWEEGFSLVQLGATVAFRTHIAAVKLKLRPILVGLDHAFPGSGSAGTTGGLTIEGTSTPQAIMVRRQQPEGGTVVAVPRTVGLAWALFLPWDIALNPQWWVANALWMVALVLPVSFLTVRSARTEREPGHGIAWWPLALVLATLAATPATGLSQLGIGEWAGALAGISAGWLLERWTAVPSHQGLKSNAHDGSILS
jgi:hypothetical protein